MSEALSDIHPSNDHRNLRRRFDYSAPASRDFFPPSYQLKGTRKPEASRSYQNKLYLSANLDLPTKIRRLSEFRKSTTRKDFQDAYRRPNEFTNQFQPSYASTVPTVTTTIRRFYSPPFPRCSDHLPWRTSSTRDSRKSSRDDEYVKQESYEYDYENTDSEERTRDETTSKREIPRVLDDFNDLNSTKVARVGGSPLFEEVYGRFRDRNRDQDNFDSADDFEARGSIGLGQVLHQSYRRISVRQQNPVEVETKIRDEFNSRGEEVRHTLAKPEPEEKKEGTTERYQRDDEETNNSNGFLSTTIPSVIESTIKASTNSRESSTSLNSSVAKSEYSNENEKRSIDGVVGDFQESTSNRSLRTSLRKNANTTRLTHRARLKLPSFEGADSDDYIDQPTSLDRIAAITSNYRDREISSFQNHLGTVSSTLVSSTGSWFSSSPRDRSNARIPAKSHSAGKAEGDAPLKHENDTENEEKIAAESTDVESSVADEAKKTSDESKDNKGATEGSRASLRSSRPETLRHIEESIDRNNSPYQVTLTMNRDEELVPTGQNIISKLIARQGKERIS
ncbi:hypothetical protein K0M31_011186 [Melipona bicolor]|uniref:Uncharacterized protein n=1 Tax=Melipona bicolor TaxID=60889 RepID=A0AA40KUD8_9HYME|nr:hypothetical protein K0M31_011186 [Melipona bicolor]